MDLIYCGSAGDPSGYGSANRADITALYIRWINIVVQTVNQTLATTTYGWQGELTKHLEGSLDKAKIKIIHLTPDLYPNYLEEGKYHIGRLAWEVNKLPDEWIEPCNKVNEIWTMTEAQKDIIRNSGVKVPIYVFPEPVDITNAEKAIEPWVIPNFNGVIFYGIFQWIERKDPYSLLSTYWKTFQKEENVILVLKTYKTAYSDSDFAKIREDIQRWKKQLKLTYYPRVVLIKELWPMDKIWKLHKMGGMYINTSHGEGWNRGAIEASLMGNSVVAINKTGFADVYPKDIFYPISCTEADVIPQSTIPWYVKTQKWWNINTQDLSKTLLNMYNNPKEAKEKGMKSAGFVKNQFNYHKVGNAMKDRLLEIERFI